MYPNEPYPGCARITLAGATLLLHPFRAALWEQEQTMLLADLHLGKARHFRKAGLPVPQEVSDASQDRLCSLLIDLRPRRVVFLGDLFHSAYNRDWGELAEIIAMFREVEFCLVPGNHDILKPDDYLEAGLRLLPSAWPEGPFLFSHHPVLPEEDPLEERGSTLYNIAGHIHPSVTLRGKGRQARRLPCFFFGERQGILPAFGGFTGHARVRASAKDRVFVIGDGVVLEV